mgnify:FL=1
MGFEVRQFGKPELNNPVLIEGLPGIGNVGKIAADFMIDTLNAKKFIEIYSTSFPNSVFVNEFNLVDLPVINVYYKKMEKQDIMFVAGDIQPLNEEACYNFCNIVLDIFEKYKGKEIITMGGIGMPKIPRNPIVYCTANNQDVIKRYKTKNLDEKIFGVVGPIIGVTGLLVGLAGKKNIPAIDLLAQTFGHPNYLGIKGSREILNILNKKLNLNLELDKLDKEIQDIEKEIRTKKIIKLPPSLKIKDETSYIG